MSTGPSSSCAACNFNAFKTGLHDEAAETNLLRPFLQNNEPPLEPQARELQSSIHARTSDIEALDSYIVSLQQTLNEAIELRKKCRRHIAKARTIFSPMRSIPDDILGLIFDRVYKATCNSVQLFTDQEPWTLAQVCRRWRTQAFGICTLWNDIFFDMSTIRNMDSTTLAMLLRLLLRRSREADLNLTFDNLEAGDAPQMHLLTRLLQPHSHRMASLDLRGDAIDYMMEALSGCPYPRLRSLDINFGDYLECFPDMVPDTRGLITTFQYCQQLRNVALSGVPTNFIVPWELLATLEIDAAGIWIIPKATSMVSLQVSTVMSLENDQEDLVPLTTLAHLENLKLTDSEPLPDGILPPPFFFLSRIHAPSLTTLTVELEAMGAVTMPDFPPLPPTLVNLGVIGNMIFGRVKPNTTPTIIRFLERVHGHVKTLYLEGHMVRALASAWDDNPLLFPAITKLRLRWARAFAEEGIRLRRAVMAREVLRESGVIIVPLEEIRVYRGWYRGQDTRTEFYSTREKEPDVWRTALPHSQLNIEFMDYEAEHEF
ncbi:hypothetical protein CYLTODRAFT_443605 [Cylindrobasidium torrendii FP15055 ss-10]|uniref:F-box domain-containing protein n=1 Tax=Cylindrobasidium torrendii FP15055 ss-10 TaxID=1314674 RepID=A0A0D7BD61_9AGAR|nr:hypothetical protein CYLTODRAFT_443605 [Cylindrobasidium torrendii FP15055 ss-10]